MDIEKLATMVREGFGAVHARFSGVDKRFESREQEIRDMCMSVRKDTFSALEKKIA